MALFKKLNEEIKKSDIKQEAFNLSEKEKRALEQEIIFGTILEELDVDYIEEAKTGIDAEAVRLKRIQMAKLRKQSNQKDSNVDAYSVDAAKAEVPEKPEPVKNEN